MAARATWTGTVRFGLVNLPVKVYRKVGKSEKDETLKRLCSCHNEPFTQTLECPGGMAPRSQVAEERGDPDLTDTVHGVEQGSGYAVVDEASLAKVKEANKQKSFSVEFYDPSDVPFYLDTGQYYLKADGKGNDMVLALFHAALRETGKVAIGEWSPNGSPHQAVIFDAGDELLMVTLPYTSQIDDDYSVVRPVSEKELEMAVKLIEQNSVDSFGLLDEDPSVEARAKLIEAAVQGKVPDPVDDDEDEEPTGSLADVLKASLGEAA